MGLFTRTRYLTINNTIMYIHPNYDTDNNTGFNPFDNPDGKTVIVTILIIISLIVALS